MTKFYVSIKVAGTDGQAGKLSGPIIASDAAEAENIIRTAATAKGLKVLKVYQVAPWKDELIGGVVPTTKPSFGEMLDEALATNNEIARKRIDRREHSAIESYPDMDTFLSIAL